MTEETIVYMGQRPADGSGTKVRRIDMAGHRRPLPLRLDIYNHSPTGFEWGYGGSGPAQLALAILADALHDDRKAARLHQRFKWKVIGGLDRSGFVLTRTQVLGAVLELENERAETDQQQ